MITLYSCCGKVSEAEATLNEMIETGIEPTILVLTSTMTVSADDRFCCCLLNVMAQTPDEEMGMLTDCVEKGNAKLGSVVRYLVEEQEAQVSNSVVVATEETLSRSFSDRLTCLDERIVKSF
ncbi:hypothetical protein PIB30_018579 [Stylosanthes scabra]|uniref:Pentatricopeptide repeat-containing protein n=1 Tax=Stylosanthes scabra TaxID=79078 RepID=A0ABU6R8A2_9FABA|nr:hypothetical protein [Stylosanthes scabra]